MDAKAELAEFVTNHLQGAPIDVVLGTVCTGLALIGTATVDAQERRGNWSTMMANLKTGIANIRAAVGYLQSQGGPPHAGLVQFANRQATFGQLMLDEITRIQAGESTPV